MSENAEGKCWWVSVGKQVPPNGAQRVRVQERSDHSYEATLYRSNGRWYTRPGIELAGACNVTHWLKHEIAEPAKPADVGKTVRCEVHVTNQGEWEWCDADTGYWHSMSVAILLEYFAYIEDQHGNRWRQWPLGWSYEDSADDRKVRTVSCLGGDADLAKFCPAVPVAFHFNK